MVVHGFTMLYLVVHHCKTLDIVVYKVVHAVVIKQTNIDFYGI